MSGNLGQLEAKIMDVLWEDPGEQLRVRDVLQRLGDEQPRAYTTVMTVMDNLFRKGWVDRRQEGKGYLYWPVQTREEAAAGALRELLDAAGNRAAVLMHFAKTASRTELSALRAAVESRSRKK